MLIGGRSDMAGGSGGHHQEVAALSWPQLWSASCSGDDNVSWDVSWECGVAGGGLHECLDQPARGWELSVVLKDTPDLAKPCGGRG